MNNKLIYSNNALRCLPQAVQRVIPPLAGQFIILIKDSSIVSLVSIQETDFFDTGSSQLHTTCL